MAKSTNSRQPPPQPPSRGPQNRPSPRETTTFTPEVPSTLPTDGYFAEIRPGPGLISVVFGLRIGDSEQVVDVASILGATPCREAEVPGVFRRYLDLYAAFARFLNLGGAGPSDDQEAVPSVTQMVARVLDGMRSAVDSLPEYTPVVQHIRSVIHGRPIYDHLFRVAGDPPRYLRVVEGQFYEELNSELAEMFGADAETPPDAIG